MEHGKWDLRTCFNIETVGAQSQASVRARTVKIEFYQINKMHVID